MSRGSESSFEPDRRRISLPLVALITLVSVSASAAIVWNDHHVAVAEAVKTIETHEARLRKLEDAQSEMRGDIKEIKNNADWIRRTIERSAH